MSDPRLTLVRDGLAAESLMGLVDARDYLPATAARCVAAVAGLREQAAAAAVQQDQLVFGEAFDILFEQDGLAFGQARRDGYVGFVDRNALTPGLNEPTHWISARSTFAFAAPDLKSPILMTLTMNSLVSVERSDGRYALVADSGWVFEGHLTPIGDHGDDPAAVAQSFVGVPYQWGGREAAGLDCSGLIQQALYACGRACPRDTDMQEASLGEAIDGSALRRNDLVFWRGHVGMMLDGERVIHANSHHMAAEIEPLDLAISRIIGMVGEPTSYRRIVP